MVLAQKTKEAEITEQDSLLRHKGGKDEERPVPIDKGKGPAWPFNNNTDGSEVSIVNESVLPDLQMHPFGGNVDKVCSIPGALYQKLEPYQQEGLHWLWGIHCQHSGGIVADDMGMGKTLQTAVFLSGLLRSNIIRRVMIIVPVTVIASWSKELEFAGMASESHIYYGSDERGLQIVNENGGVLVTNYETYVSKHRLLLVPDWDYVVLDEAHRIKNLNSTVRKQVDNIGCKKKLLLTGTPLPRDLLDIFSLMKFINPDILGDQDAFHNKYMIPVQLGQYMNSTKINKKQFIKALTSCRKMISPYILRRTKAILIESGVLPCTKSEVIVWLRLTDLQAELYSRFCKLIDQESHRLNDEDKSVMTQAGICRQICNGPELLLETSNGGQGHSTRRLARTLVHSIDSGAKAFRNINNSCKLSFILDLMSELFEEEKAEKEKYEEEKAEKEEYEEEKAEIEKYEKEKSEKEKAMALMKRKKLKILVFSQFLSMLDRIESALQTIVQERDIIRIDGSITRIERDKKIKEFNSESEDSPKIFLLSARVGGEGLNLTAATRVIIVDPSWNISDDNQISDRVFRIGQTHDVTIYRLFTCMTIEEDIYKTQLIKGNLAKALLEGMLCSPLIKIEDKKFIRLPECGFNSSETQQLIETMIGDVLQMSTRHRMFLQTHHLVGGLTNQSAVSSYKELSLVDLPLSESSDEEGSDSEESHNADIDKSASTPRQEQTNVRRWSKRVSGPNGSKNLNTQEETITVTSQIIYVRANKVSALIGKYGDTIKTIQTRSSTKIITNPYGHPRDKMPDPCPVEIQGTLKEITKAKQLISDTISKTGESYTDVAANGGTEIQFSVPQDLVGLIIGSRGQRVKEIENKSGARIRSIPGSKFRIRGTSQEVDNAKELMSKIINRHAGLSSGYMPVTQGTQAPPQGTPSPCARSEYYGERGTAGTSRPRGNFEHQLERQNYYRGTPQPPAPQPPAPHILHRAPPGPDDSGVQGHPGPGHGVLARGGTSQEQQRQAGGCRQIHRSCGLPPNSSEKP